MSSHSSETEKGTESNTLATSSGTQLFRKGATLSTCIRASPPPFKNRLRDALRGMPVPERILPAYHTGVERIVGKQTACQLVNALFFHTRDYGRAAFDHFGTLL